MAGIANSKVFGQEKHPLRATQTVDETWTVVSASTTEVSHNLQTDTVKVVVKNLASYDGAALSGVARVALSSGQTATGQNYLTLAAGEEVEIDSLGITALYFLRDGTTDVKLCVREKQI